MRGPAHDPRLPGARMRDGAGASGPPAPPSPPRRPTPAPMRQPPRPALPPPSGRSTRSSPSPSHLGGRGPSRRTRRCRHLLERAYGGYAPADAVPIASATKLLSTLVILSLVKDGFLDARDSGRLARARLAEGQGRHHLADAPRPDLGAARAGRLPREHGPGRCPPAPRRLPGCRSALRRARRSSTAAPGSRWPAAWPSSPRGSRGRSCRRPG